MKKNCSKDLTPEQQKLIKAIEKKEFLQGKVDEIVRQQQEKAKKNK